MYLLLIKYSNRIEIGINTMHFNNILIAKVVQLWDNNQKTQ